MKSQDEAMLKVIHDALDFCNWAAGQGFCNEAGKPDPDELLCVYANAIEVNDFDGIPSLVRDAVASLFDINREAGGIMSERICGHMKPFATRCIECELIMAREAVAHAKDSLNQNSKLVAKLEAEQRMRATLAPS